MYLHHDALRLVAHERMNAYLREAAANRQIRIATGAAVRDRPGTKTAAASLLRFVARALRANRPEGRLACRETGRSAS